jgi:hypothetical protein
VKLTPAHGLAEEEDAVPALGVPEQLGTIPFMTMPVMDAVALLLKVMLTLSVTADVGMDLFNTAPRTPSVVVHVSSSAKVQPEG